MLCIPSALHEHELRVWVQVNEAAAVCTLFWEKVCFCILKMKVVRDWLQSSCFFPDTSCMELLHPKQPWLGECRKINSNPVQIKIMQEYSKYCI